jgi:hypothetical protein
LGNKKFIGTWNLVSCEARSSEGDVRYPYGENPKGKLMYDASGSMSATLMSQGRPHFESNDLIRGTPEEIKAAFEGFTGYCGSYTIDEEKQTVTHHLEVSWFPNWENTSQVRLYKFSDNRLQLDTEPRPSRRASWTLSLVWEKEE